MQQGDVIRATVYDAGSVHQPRSLAVEGATPPDTAPAPILRYRQASARKVRGRRARGRVALVCGCCHGRRDCGSPRDQRDSGWWRWPCIRARNARRSDLARLSVARSTARCGGGTGADLLRGRASRTCQ